LHGIRPWLLCSLPQAGDSIGDAAALPTRRRVAEVSGGHAARTEMLRLANPVSIKRQKMPFLYNELLVESGLMSPGDDETKIVHGRTFRTSQ
jgi:hypothetical protein